MFIYFNTTSCSLLCVLVAHVASLKSWSRRVKRKRRIICPNLPVEVWVYSFFCFLFHINMLTVWRNNNCLLVSVAVLPWWRVPVRQLSVSGDASIQARREDCTGQLHADGRLKHVHCSCLTNITFLTFHQCKSCSFWSVLLWSEFSNYNDYVFPQWLSSVVLMPTTASLNETWLSNDVRIPGGRTCTDMLNLFI